MSLAIEVRDVSRSFGRVRAVDGVSLLVPAGATSQAGNIANVVTMVAGAPDGCQGVVFTIALTLSGSQS